MQAMKAIRTDDMDFTIQYSLSDCGGLLSGPVDIVSSPMGANGRYPSNMACVWSVTYPAGSVVNVSTIPFLCTRAVR